MKKPEPSNGYEHGDEALAWLLIYLPHKVSGLVILTMSLTSGMCSHKWYYSEKMGAACAEMLEPSCRFA